MTPPQSDYDKRTDKMAEAHGVWAWDWPGATQDSVCRAAQSFGMGRLSAKQSLEILAKAIVKYKSDKASSKATWDADDAIAAVKARGDWPL